MKPRKKPLGLVIALGTLLAAAFGFSLINSGLLQTPPPTPDAAPVQADATIKTKASELAAATAGKLKPSKPTAAPMDEDGRSEKMGDPPSILVSGNATKMLKPVPNDSSTSTQWFVRESANGNK